MSTRSHTVYVIVGLTIPAPGCIVTTPVCWYVRSFVCSLFALVVVSGKVWFSWNLAQMFSICAKFHYYLLRAQLARISRSKSPCQKSADIRLPEVYFGMKYYCWQNSRWHFCWKFAVSECFYSVSKKFPLRFSDVFLKRLGIFSPNFTHLLNVLIHVGLQIFTQLSETLTKLCHIKCNHPACISVDGAHFEHIMVVVHSMA